MKRGGRSCPQCGQLTYPARRNAEEAARRKGCPVTAVFRCGGSWHFNPNTYRYQPREAR